MNDILEKIHNGINFVKKDDIWRIRLTDLPPGKSFLLKLLRVFILSHKGFNEDQCRLRASALTFYSLVSIVPVAAMAFGIAKGFGFEKVLETQLRTRLAGQEEVLANVIKFSHSLLENTRGGLIAGAGLVVLLWAVVKVLGQIEYSFNDIWKIKEKRTLGRMFGDYLSLMLVCPVILTLSSGMTVFITTQVNLIVEKFSILGNFSSLIFILLKLLPYALMGTLFSFLFIFIPNTKVRFSSGVFAGFITGVVFQILQWAYITFQIGVVKYNAIYGSFAALPLFLAWLQLSWLIVLYGAEISFAFQNTDAYEFEPDVRQSSRRQRTLLALLICRRLVKNFMTRGKPMTAGELSAQLEIPIRFIGEIISELVKSNIISVAEIEGTNERGYQPAIDVSFLTISYVIGALEKRGIDSIHFTGNPEFVSLAASLESFDETIRQLPENRLLKEI